MPKIKIKFEINRDAWNWWHACNKVSYGNDWKKFIDKDVADKLHGKTQEQAYKFLIPYLNSIYSDIDTKKLIKTIQEGFQQKQAELFQIMEQVTKHKIYRDDFTCFLTSFPRFPYNYEKGYIWISYKRPIENLLLTFIHELLHFQYFKYYGERIWGELGQEKHGELKEAMTIIINDEFSHVTNIKDNGYEIHQDLRKKLIKLWRKSCDMDIFIEDAIKILK
ncbi:MAG: hypothetical protein Q8Q23_04950 [bacterium]|nr:hypothetical protein [bacterium]